MKKKIKEFFKNYWKFIIYTFSILIITITSVYFLGVEIIKDNQNTLNQAGVIKEYFIFRSDTQSSKNKEEFTYTFNKLKNNYNCYIKNTNEYVDVELENVYTIHDVTTDDNTIILSYQSVAKESSMGFGYYLKEEYKLYFYIGVYM